MSLFHSFPHVPISATNAFFIKLCFSKYLGTSVFSFLPPPIMSPSLTSFCPLSNCYVLIFSCSPAPLSVFFGHLSTSVSVLLAHAFFLPSHLHVPLRSCVCKTHSQNIHSVWFPSFLLFNLEEETKFKVLHCHSLSIIKPTSLHLLPLFGPKAFPPHIPTAQQLLSLCMETISLTFLPLPNLYHLVSFPCSSMMFYILSLFCCPTSPASGEGFISLRTKLATSCLSI